VCGACGRSHTRPSYTQLTQPVAVVPLLAHAALEARLLPPGWSYATDSHTGRVYCYHTRDRRSAWEPPPPRLSRGALFAKVCQQVGSVSRPCYYWDDRLCPAGRAPQLSVVRVLDARAGSPPRCDTSLATRRLPDADVLPPVFTIALGWPRGAAPKETALALMRVLPWDGLNLRSFLDIMQVAACPEGGGAHTHRLDGFIVFWGCHYFAYWRRSGSEDEWDSIDDATVRKVGTWEDVVEKVVQGKYMPLLLFFAEVPHGAP
jgi:hypothetical protein